jgi:hypothetical protein
VESYTKITKRTRKSLPADKVRGGLAEQEKIEEIGERAEKTLDRDRPSHGRS